VMDAAHLILDGNKKAMGQLEGILAQTDYASMYLGKITEMMEKALEKAGTEGSSETGHL